jgi:hypothetical protein
VLINPLQSYNVTVPAGGFVTLRWYAQ